MESENEVTEEQLTEMSKPNLINLGEARTPPLGLTMDEKKGDMVARLMGVDVAPVAAPSPAKQPAPATDNIAKIMPAHGALYDLQGNKWSGDYYRLVVAATEKETGAVEVTVNGWMIRFRRGVTVVLPEPYLEVLKNSVISHVIKDADTGEQRQIDIMQYPMNIEGKCPGPTRVVA